MELGEVPHRRLNRRLMAAVVVIAGLAVPIVWIVLTRTDRSTGDIAFIELRTRDVFSSEPPLVGAYSRYGWSHPGPLMFYVYAIPYRLFGQDANALRLTAVLVNVAVLGAMAWLLARRGVAATVAMSAATVALVWGLLPNSLSDGWNVTIAVLAFLLTIVACWCAICGDRWALMVAAFAFTFVLQAHIGFGVVLVPLFLATLVVRARRRPWRSWASSGTNAWRVAGIAAVAATAIPVGYDTLAHWPGNIGRLAKWSLRNDEPKVGLVDGLKIIGRTSSLSFPVNPQFPGRFVLTIDTVAVGIAPGTLLVLLAGALVISLRRGWHAETALCCCLALVWAAGLVAALNIAEPLLPWLIDWLQPLGWSTWAAVSIVAWRLVQQRVQQHLRWPQFRSAALGVAAITFAVGTVAYARHSATTDYVSAEATPVVKQLTQAAESVGTDQEIFIAYEGDQLFAGTLMAGVVADLDRSGYDMCVDASFGHQYGSARVCPGRPNEYLLIRLESFVTPAPDGWSTLSISDPLTADERAEADSISERLAAILVSNGREDQVFLLYTQLVGALMSDDPPDELQRQSALVTRLEQLRQVPGQRYALYLVPT